MLMVNDHLQDWLAFSFFPGLGCTLTNRLVGEFGSPTAVLAGSAKQLQQVEGVGSRLSRILTDPALIETARDKARQELRRLAELNVKLLCPVDPAYPSRLRTIADPPPLLYSHGDTSCLKQPAVAIVGSRSASTYGRRISSTLAAALTRRGICVISGLALGIDGEAHAGALAAGGSTIGVLGCGIDVVYPRQHTTLFAKVRQRGLLLSEYGPGTEPDGFRFPERNRIISGLALGVVVVEAGLRSGSLITARLALDQGREVFAVPGRIDSAKSRGTHRLLQDGAKLVHDVDDILEELRLNGKPANGSAAESSESSTAVLSSKEQKLLALLDVYPLTIDELVRQSGQTASEVFDLLLRLELKGVVRQLPGQQYECLEGGGERGSDSVRAEIEPRRGG